MCSNIKTDTLKHCKLDRVDKIFSIGIGLILAKITGCLKGEMFNLIRFISLNSPINA